MENKPIVDCIYNFYPVNEFYVENLRNFLNWTEGDFRQTLVSYPEGFSPWAREGVKWVMVPNLNQDFGSLSRLIHEVATQPLPDALFVANSSVMGPLMEIGDPKGRWLAEYYARLSGSVGAVGDTLNGGRWYMPHTLEFKRKFGLAASARGLQSTNLLLSWRAIEDLMSAGFFRERSALSKRELVRDFEIAMSHELRGLGFGISRVGKDKSSATLGGLITGDVHTNFFALGRKPSPQTNFFIKTNRDLYTKRVLLSFASTQDANAAKHRG